MEYDRGNLKDNLITKLAMLNQPNSHNSFYTEFKRFLHKEDYDKIVGVDYFTLLKQSINEIISNVVEKFDLFYNTKQDIKKKR